MKNSTFLPLVLGLVFLNFVVFSISSKAQNPGQIPDVLNNINQNGGQTQKCAYDAEQDLSCYSDNGANKLGLANNSKENSTQKPTAKPQPYRAGALGTVLEAALLDSQEKDDKTFKDKASKLNGTWAGKADWTSVFGRNPNDPASDNYSKTLGLNKRSPNDYPADFKAKYEAFKKDLEGKAGANDGPEQQKALMEFVKKESGIDNGSGPQYKRLKYLYYMMKGSLQATQNLGCVDHNSIAVPLTVSVQEPTFGGRNLLSNLVGTSGGTISGPPKRDLMYSSVTVSSERGLFNKLYINNKGTNGKPIFDGVDDKICEGVSAGLLAAWDKGLTTWDNGQPVQPIKDEKQQACLEYYRVLVARTASYSGTDLLSSPTAESSKYGLNSDVMNNVQHFGVRDAGSFGNALTDLRACKDAKQFVSANNGFLVRPTASGGSSWNPTPTPGPELPNIAAPQKVIPQEFQCAVEIGSHFASCGASIPEGALSNVKDFGGKGNKCLEGLRDGSLVLISVNVEASSDQMPLGRCKESNPGLVNNLALTDNRASFVVNNMDKLFKELKFSANNQGFVKRDASGSVITQVPDENGKMITLIDKDVPKFGVSGPCVHYAKGELLADGKTVAAGTEIKPEYQKCVNAKAGVCPELDAARYARLVFTVKASESSEISLAKGEKIRIGIEEMDQAEADKAKAVADAAYKARMEERIKKANVDFHGYADQYGVKQQNWVGAPTLGNQLINNEYIVPSYGLCSQLQYACSNELGASSRQAR